MAPARCAGAVHFLLLGAKPAPLHGTGLQVRRPAPLQKLPDWLIFPCGVGRKANCHKKISQ
jgi:hypothetical protein